MAALAFAVLVTATGAFSASTAGAASTGQRIDLKVLVLSDGGNPTEAAIVTELASEGVPYTLVDLNSPTRPTITAAYLSGTSPTGPEAYFQSIVLPNDNPVQLTAAERAAIIAYETTFGIREVNSFLWPSAAVGLNTVTGSGPTGGYGGTLDGVQAKVTPAAKLYGPFQYLVGTVPFEDISPTVGESFGYIAVPLPNTATTSFTTLLDAPVPNGPRRGSLLGVYKNGTREQLISTIGVNQFQSQFQSIAHGIITWMTKGVHLGYDRNYFTVQVDDVIPAGQPVERHGQLHAGRRLPARVERHDSGHPDDGRRRERRGLLVAADRLPPRHRRTTVAGAKSSTALNGGQDPLKTAFLANKTRFGWINHTYLHEWLGCVQNFTVVPWQCTTDAGGNPVYVSQADIQNQITQNVALGPGQWACRSTRPSS